MSAETIAVEDFEYGLDVAGLDLASLAEALRDVVAEALADPMRLTLWATGVATAEQAVGLNLLRRLLGAAAEPIASPAAGDKRFTDPAWSGNPFLAGMLEAHLARTRAALELVDSSRLPEATRRKARFLVTLMTDAVAPSNIPWVNPTVVKEAVDTGGLSLVRGMQNYLEDLRTNAGKPRQVDTTPFELGVNLAATPGRVVLRNELIELIAYEPQTEDVYETPLLCSPPWINKYYIMDLAPGRSFIEWAVRSGHQTFAISYRNPDGSLAHLTLHDYLRSGLLAALDAIARITGAPRVDIAALCLGGTLAVILAAFLAARGDAERLGTLTLTNTMVDFREPGDLGVFTDEKTILRLERRMRERGYLEAEQMGATFDWMRANDLIWSYVINNWFMGRRPPAFDILAWNADTTRMPAAMHSEYLRTCYLQNALVRAGAYTIDGTPIDLRAVRNPLYILGAEADHIAPWRSSYRTVAHVGGEDVTYTLSNAGHIAGIVNPLDNRKAWHRTKDRASRDESADAWYASAEQRSGSWWTDWARWAGRRAGPRRLPYALPPGEPAPGRYVRNETRPPFAVYERP